MHKYLDRPHTLNLRFDTHFDDRNELTTNRKRPQD